MAFLSGLQLERETGVVAEMSGLFARNVRVSDHRCRCHME